MSFSPLTSAHGSSQPTVQSPSVSTGAVMTQVGGTLAAILLLILACGGLAKRLGLTSRKTGGQTLNISASCQLGQRERVVIIDVEDARLVLGVTSTQICHLHTLAPVCTTDNPQPVVPETDFRQALGSLLKRTGRSQ
ncbi:flagellar biosynthetic protein FliO [Erwinia sp. OLTSP20]|uniref:flagellar biosynthetic protein FliO n=1 Tax=unclassified Erwinia TaxID=2622719 RepID=UPI000C19FDC1|nr:MULTISPECIES: flagellar biosynthetic protein FliO [unclassified Erwinia]PIJ48460.1 flagellar biosynthetic protein FliO [Erwinia sp. OAMSP11]PIJ66869.1 flagellar biosynthetic protein FliO [Erwinia sp. OLSSP12]PIJ78581.1 flagellar biosynthetic protein FliO [Erwinia sp. OLCASP19]PIJ79465.1 flagellar biosynthetic protein FliO [Erwinia sp. OLMTSP26]PIJ81006.1 flagellar biosynthetic protein FliO [Erwinia sp. OLMDSP33]